MTRIVSVKKLVHIANSQRTGTRTRTLYDNVNSKLDQALSTYRASRKAIANLAPNEEFGPWKETLLELQSRDVRGPGIENHKSGTEKNKTSTSQFIQSWIWTTVPHSVSPEDPDLQATLRVEWAKAQERAKRYEEEVELVVEEMRRTLVTFERNAGEWESRATSFPLGDSAIGATTIAGIAAYANKQAAIQRGMVKIFIDDWYHLLKQLPLKPKWLKKYPCPPEPKRRRLVSNVKLYHPDSYAPEDDPPDVGDVTFGDDGATDGFHGAMDGDFEGFADH